jgi:molybdopterin-guanine dinucleotide biosynthesis protein A
VARPGASAITGLILAGGQGSRMGGLDKGWIEFRGLPLVQHVLERFAPQVDSVLISANRNLERYRTLGCGVLADDTGRFGEFQGPLAGIVQALGAAAPGLLAVVPCDAPLLPRDLVARLAAAIGDAPAAVVQCGGRVQPVFCLLRSELLGPLQSALASGLRKPADFLESVGAVVVPCESEPEFANVNTQADLDQPAPGRSGASAPHKARRQAR